MEIFGTVSERFGTRFAALQFADYFPDESEGWTDRIERWVDRSATGRSLPLPRLGKRAPQAPRRS
jgi:hypothetical protein